MGPNFLSNLCSLPFTFQGEHGVKEVLDILKEELHTCMALSGMDFVYSSGMELQVGSQVGNLQMEVEGPSCWLTLPWLDSYPEDRTVREMSYKEKKNCLLTVETMYFSQGY